MKTMHFFDDRLIFTLPDSFNEMDAEEQKKHFFGATQPIYSSFDRETNSSFAVIRTEREAAEQTLLERISEYQLGYSRMAPGFVKGQIASKRVHGKLIYALTFQSNGLNENQFNMIALTTMCGKELLFYFMAPMNDKTGLQFHVFTQIIESLTVEEAVNSDI